MSFHRHRILVVGMLLTGALAGPARAQAPEAPPVEDPLASPQLVDRIVAVVDREPILQSDVELEMQNYLFEARSLGQELPEDRSVIREDVMERLVESKLLIAQAKREGLVIGEEELEAAVAERMQELEQRYGGRTALERDLRRSGMSYDDLRLRNREVTRNRLYSTRIVQAFIRPRVNVLDNEVREYYENNLDQLPSTSTMVELAVILQAPQPEEETARRIQSQLDSIQAGLEAGRSFEELAREYSEGPNASRGGLVGTFARGDLFSRILEDVAWKLPLGEVSPPITTELGVHLILVDERTADELTLRQILFRIELTDEDRAEARRRAERIAELARGDQDFTELARNLSDDIDSRENGGVIGEVPLDQLNPQTREVVTALDVGEVSDPVAGAEGFYVFKLLDRTPGQVYSFEEIEDRLRNVLLNQKMEEELQSYLDELREDFYIEIKT